MASHVGKRNSLEESKLDFDLMWVRSVLEDNRVATVHANSTRHALKSVRAKNIGRFVTETFFGRRIRCDCSRSIQACPSGTSRSVFAKLLAKITGFGCRCLEEGLTRTAVLMHSQVSMLSHHRISRNCLDGCAFNSSAECPGGSVS